MSVLFLKLLWEVCKRVLNCSRHEQKGKKIHDEFWNASKIECQNISD